MSVAAFSQWLYATPLSAAVHDTWWVVPIVQSIHILAIASLIGSAVILDLKLAGFVARSDPAAIVFRRHMPWLWGALATLLVTGLMMIIGEPDRVLMNWVFWTKMILVLIGFCITLIMRVPMLRHDLDANPGVWRLIVKPLGLLSLGIWILIIFCGRWIAYAI